MERKQRATLALIASAGGTLGTFLALRLGGHAETSPALLLGMFAGFAAGFAVTYGLLALIFRNEG